MSNGMVPQRGGSAGTILAFVIVALVLGAILGWGFGVFSRKAKAVPPPVVPPPANLLERQTLPENKPGEMETRSDLSIFDLRFWKPVSSDRAFVEPVSPVNYTNYLRVVKRKNVSRLYAHYATGGLRIDLQCVTHGYDILRKQFDDLHGRQGRRSTSRQLISPKNQSGRPSWY